MVQEIHDVQGKISGNHGMPIAENPGQSTLRAPPKSFKRREIACVKTLNSTGVPRS